MIVRLSPLTSIFCTRPALISEVNCESEICCVEKGGSSLWIVILIILIILVVLAIIFREKLKLEWFKLTGKFGSKPVMPSKQNAFPQRFGPTGIRPQTMQSSRPPQTMPPQQRMSTRPSVRPVTAKDKEMEEALRKLRDMSKK